MAQRNENGGKSIYQRTQYTEIMCANSALISFQCADNSKPSRRCPRGAVGSCPNAIRPCHATKRMRRLGHRKLAFDQNEVTKLMRSFAHWPCKLAGSVAASLATTASPGLNSVARSARSRCRSSPAASTVSIFLSRRSGRLAAIMFQFAMCACLHLRQRREGLQ